MKNLILAVIALFMILLLFVNRILSINDMFLSINKYNMLDFGGGIYLYYTNRSIIY